MCMSYPSRYVKKHLDIDTSYHYKIRLVLTNASYFTAHCISYLLLHAKST